MFLKVHKNIDVSKYGSWLLPYKLRNAKIVEREDIEQCLKRLPHEEYLMIKVNISLFRVIGYLHI
jgi:hypothetical protein